MSEEMSAIEKAAFDMGWLPKDQFKGDPERWTDAEAFVKRGEDFLPILKANNRKLTSEIATLKASDAENKRLIKESNDQIAQLLEINTAASRKEAKATKVELLTALETARKDGDVDTAVKIQTQIDEHEAAIKKAETTTTKTEERKPPQDASQSPEWKEWIAENPWYGVDEDRTALAVAIGGKLRGKGNTLQGKDFFDAVSKEVLRILPPASSPREDPSKVEAGRSSGGGGGGASGKRYTDLPSDVRANCDRLAASMKIPGPAFKDLNAYRQHFANKYFESA
jgi:hypothetical protein